MSVPPLRLGNSFESYISGEVIVHPSAVIAPGVILQAAPNSKILIGAGVCIGMGSIIQVDTGTLIIEAGAILGAGFLMVGEGKIGANACIGAATTVFRCSVSPGQVLAPGSIVGDHSRNTIEVEAGSEKPTPGSTAQTTQQPELEDVWAPTSNNSNGSNGYNPSTSKVNNPSVVPSQSETNNNPNLPVSQPSENSIQPLPNTENTFGTHISGQTSIQRLLVTLFPHRQALNKPLLDDSESE
jgi:carbon dioxide concentrating mechanism protein CcmN